MNLVNKDLSKPAFLSDVLDRDGEHREHQSHIETLWNGDNSRILLVDGNGRVRVESDLMKLSTLEFSEIDQVNASFLGKDAKLNWFARYANELDDEIPGRWLDLRSVAQFLPSDEANLAAYACALLHWQKHARYCGACGARTELRSAGHKTVCSDCAIEYFPRTDSVVIAIVEHDGACLLGRQATWPAKRYAALAGFVEPGESLEAALKREVMEEAGVSIESARYIASQPWPFPTSLMIGFLATAKNKQMSIGVELEDARWFTPEQLETAVNDGEISLPSFYSLSRHLIEVWFRERTERQLRAP